jgi:hypothetical protein
VSTLLGEQLEESLFSKVTVLGAPGSGTLDDRTLVAGAQEAGADLLMMVEQVAYTATPEVKTHTSNWFWWLTGPFVYLFEDRSYRVDCTIEVALYDVHRLAAAGAPQDPSEPAEDDLLNRDALVRRFRAKADWVTSSFTERTETGMEYAYSIFVPTAYLASDGERVTRLVAVDSLSSMADALANDIATDADFVVRQSQRETPYYLANGTKGGLVTPQLQGAGADQRLVFEAEILQRRAGAQRDFQTAQIRVGDDVFDLAQGEVADGYVGSIAVDSENPGSAGWVRKKVQAAIPVDATCVAAIRDQTFQFLLNDSRDAQSLHSWTFPIGVENVRAIEASILAGEFEGVEAVEGVYSKDDRQGGTR